MGLCISTKTTSSPETVKLIFPTGDLKEFSWSVRPSYILTKDDQQSTFICDSDTMEIGRAVRSVEGDRELRLGQIYFVLPKCMLNRVMKGEEMAKLVIKASNALRKINGGKRGRKRAIVPISFSMVEKEEKNIVGRKGRKFKSDLSVINE